MSLWKHNFNRLTRKQMYIREMKVIYFASYAHKLYTLKAFDVGCERRWDSPKREKF